MAILTSTPIIEANLMTLKNDVLMEGCWQENHLKTKALPLRIVVAAALIDIDGRVLIGKRPQGKPMAGLWEFPGGKLEDGESPETCLIRELSEELAIETRHSCLAPIAFASHDYEDFHLLMTLFACRTWQGMPQALVHEELAWCKAHQLHQYHMPPADLPMIALLRDLI